VNSLRSFFDQAFKDWSVTTIGRDFVVNLAAGLVVSIFVIAVASRWPLIRSYLVFDAAAFRRLFGPAALKAREMFITLDVYQNVADLPQEIQEKLGGTVGAPGGNRYFKIFPDGHVATFPGASEGILGHCSARGAGYLVDALSRIPSVAVRIRTVADREVAGRSDATFVNLGGSASNIKSDDLKHIDGGRFLIDDLMEFKLGQGRPVQQEKDRSRKGVILKHTNPYSPGHSLLMCAGLGEWGTSGAAWFLARNWKKLSRRFKSRPFLIVVRVLPQADDTAHEILSIGQESIRYRAHRVVRSVGARVVGLFRVDRGSPRG